MNTELLKFISENHFDSMHTAVEFYKTFGIQEISDNNEYWKTRIVELVHVLDSRGQLDQALDIVNKKCLYDNELGQYAQAIIHEIKFNRLKAFLAQSDRDKEMAELINLVG